MRQFIIKVIKYFIIGLGLLTVTCSTPPQIEMIKLDHNIWKGNTFLIIDNRKLEHQYINFPILYEGEQATMYCQIHHKWEIIRARYNVQTQRYDYIVVPHPKPF